MKWKGKGREQGERKREAKGGGKIRHEGEGTETLDVGKLMILGTGFYMSI